MPRPKLPSQSDLLVQQLEEKARELTSMPVVQSEPEVHTTDQVFEKLRQLCPELLNLLVEQNRLSDLNRLVDYLRAAINNSVQAAHWLQQGDAALQEALLSKDVLEDLIRRVGLNLDYQQMENFQGQPGELIECRLPPSVALDLYHAAYPLIVAHGVRDLKGEAHPILDARPLPPENLNHDRFWGRPAPYKPGEILVVQQDGSFQRLSDGRNPSADDFKDLDAAIRAEVKRQGHEVDYLRLHPTNNNHVVTVELEVKDKLRPVDNKALREVIERELRVGVELDKVAFLSDLRDKGMLSSDTLMEELGLKT